MKLESKKVRMTRVSAAMLTCHVCKNSFDNNNLSQCPECGWDAGHTSEGGKERPTSNITPIVKREAPEELYPWDTSRRRLASVRCAQHFHPNHAYDANYTNPVPSPVLFDTQQSLVDIVLNQSTGTPTTANPSSQFLQLIMDPVKKDGEVSQSARKKLFEAFQNSSLVSEGVVEQDSVMQISNNISDQDVNRLKAEGLIFGQGRNCGMTEKGRKALVLMMLDSNSVTTANNLNKLLKVSYRETPKQVIKAPNKKITRDKDGNWTEESDLPEDIDDQVSDFSTAKLNSMYAAIEKGLTSSASLSNYNSNALSKLKIKIQSELIARSA